MNTFYRATVLRRSIDNHSGRKLRGEWGEEKSHQQTWTRRRFTLIPIYRLPLQLFIHLVMDLQILMTKMEMVIADKSHGSSRGGLRGSFNSVLSWASYPCRWTRQKHSRTTIRWNMSLWHWTSPSCLCLRQKWLPRYETLVFSRNRIRTSGDRHVYSTESWCCSFGCQLSFSWLNSEAMNRRITSLSRFLGPRGFLSCIVCSSCSCLSSFPRP